jgi:hypothetical protein
MNVICCARWARMAPIVLLFAMPATTALGLGATSGAISPAPAPPSLVWNQFESNTTIFLIEERLSLLTSSAIPVDVDGTPGLYDQVADLPGGSIPAGSVVNVHLLHFDPVSVPQRLAGSVTFATQIVGLMLRRPQLMTSDPLGAPGAAYPSAPNANYREFELTPGSAAGDSVTISPDRLTLSVDWGVTVYYDELRVITSVPEPGTAMLSFVGVLGLLRRRAPR